VESVNTFVEIIPIYALTDNYCYLVHRKGSKRAMLIDASETEPIQRALHQYGLHLELIISTHHHHDHIGANQELQAETGAEIWSSLYDLQRVPGSKRGLTDGEKFSFDGIDCEAMMIPGHTLGQISIHIPEAQALFVGDTMFAMGCGRLFEGTFEQMYESLRRIVALPQTTRVYFGHEYTANNGGFALQVDPDNRLAIEERMILAREYVVKNKCVPAPTIADEMRVNPFLRARTLSEFRSLRERRNHY